VLVVGSDRRPQPGAAAADDEHVVFSHVSP